MVDYTDLLTTQIYLNPVPFHVRDKIWRVKYHLQGTNFICMLCMRVMFSNGNMSYDQSFSMDSY